MTSNENSVNDQVISSTLTLQDLYYQYPITYVSISDLYTYELIILLIYGIMIIFSFFTNFIAIIIFFFGRRSRSELTPFLLNLSIFNIIMTVYCIPFTITSIIFQRWLYASALCVVLDGFKTFSVSGVLLTLITIAIDRYCVVKYPLTIKIYSPKQRNLIAILIIWILSIALAMIWSPARSLPMSQKRLWVSSRTVLNDYLKSVENMTDASKANDYLEQIQYTVVNTLQCLPNKIQRPVEVRRTILNFLQTYFIPLFILAFVYLRIAAMLWQRRNDVNSDLNNPASKNLFSNENIQFRKKLKQVGSFFEVRSLQAKHCFSSKNDVFFVSIYIEINGRKKNLLINHISPIYFFFVFQDIFSLINLEIYVKDLIKSDMKNYI